MTSHFETRLDAWVGGAIAALLPADFTNRNLMCDIMVAELNY